jgi:Fic family protein
MIVSYDTIMSMEQTLSHFRATAHVIQRLTDIAKRIGQLEGINLQRPAPKLRRKNRIQTIQASLSIEGNSLTRDQVTALIDRKRVIGPRQDILEVQNAIAVYNRLAAFDPISVDALLNAHQIMMEGLIPSAGAFRKGPIGVLRPGNRFHEAPPWREVAPMVQALFDYLGTTDDHLLVQSCRFHYQLEFIHPFMDGNGRMGRLWQTLLLMRYHPVFEFLPVEEYIKEHQQDYYRDLAAGDDTGDCTGFVVLMLALISASLDELIHQAGPISLDTSARLELAKGSFGHQSFTRKDYLSIFKTISTATASRDLQFGVQTKLLKKTGDKRTARYGFR